MNKKLSIILVTYNSENDIFDCLYSIMKHNDIDKELEIIVVDNNSANVDTMFEKLDLLYNSNIILIKNRSNGGYGQGNNIGIKRATSPIVLIMNPDVRLFKPIFRDAITAFENNSKVALVGMTQYEMEKKRGQSFLMIEQTPFNLLLHKIYNTLNCYNSTRFCFSGACFFVRKNVLIDIGMFDEDIFLYSEERDLHQRILKHQERNQVLYRKDLGYIHPLHDRVTSVNSIMLGIKSALYVGEKNNYSVRKSIKSILNIYDLIRLKSKIVGNKTDELFYKQVIQAIKQDYKMLLKK